MAAVWKRVGNRVQSAGATSIAPLKPVTIEAPSAGILIAAVTSSNNDVHACATAGWILLDQEHSGAGFTASLWIAQANAANPTFTWTGSVACSAQISYYDDGSAVLDLSTVAISVANGTANPHTSASINTTRADSHVLYVDVAAANTAVAAPAGWTECSDAGSATDNGRHAWGGKNMSASGSASGAISITGAAAPWVQWQLEIRRTVPAQLEFSSAESGAWVAPDALAFSKVEAGAWLWPAATEFSKMEAGAWLAPPPVSRSAPLLMVN